VAPESENLSRTFVLVWRRLGSARILVVLVLVVVLVLAAVGLWNLIAPRKQIESAASDTPFLKSTPPAPATKPATSAVARISPGIASPPPSSTPSPAPQPVREVVITDVAEKERRGPRGETFVVATIGMSSQTTTEKEKLEIQVLFFDLTPDNQMRPTDAQVTYQWLTPVRDWTDPTPKYLAATYLKPPSLPPPRRRLFFAKPDPRRVPDRLRYGGFVVRVYVDGKLQDERSKPESLIASLRNNAPPPAPPTDPSSVQPSTFNPQPNSSVPPSAFRAAPSITPPSSILNPPSSPPGSPTDHRSPATEHSSESLPKGIPIPNKPGFVQSPYDPKFIIDVRGFPPGTLVNDPNTNKPFRVP
jgi:hypothetical protein